MILKENRKKKLKKSHILWKEEKSTDCHQVFLREHPVLNHERLTGGFLLIVLQVQKMDHPKCTYTNKALPRAPHDGGSSHTFSGKHHNRVALWSACMLKHRAWGRDSRNYKFACYYKATIPLGSWRCGGIAHLTAMGLYEGQAGNMGAACYVREQWRQRAVWVQRSKLTAYGPELANIPTWVSLKWLFATDHLIKKMRPSTESGRKFNWRSGTSSIPKYKPWGQYCLPSILIRTIDGIEYILSKHKDGTQLEMYNTWDGFDVI